jgi:hypothetical protein
MNNIAILIKTGKTVFSVEELQKLFAIPTKKGLESFLYRAKKGDILQNPYQGFWALPNYDPMELACKIKPQSYISCETVLFKEGIFFQYYGNTISCASNDSRTYKINDKTYAFYKIKSDILNNPIGIRDHEHYRIATPERALCDYIYLHPTARIDNPSGINMTRLKQILPIYPQSTNRYIKKLLGKKELD